MKKHPLIVFVLVGLLTLPASHLILSTVEAAEVAGLRESQFGFNESQDSNINVNPDSEDIEQGIIEIEQPFKPRFIDSSDILQHPTKEQLPIVIEEDQGLDLVKDPLKPYISSPFKIFNGGTEVYYLDRHKNAHLFPNEFTYVSWFGANYGIIRLMSEADFALVDIEEPVTYHPGLMVKSVNDNKVYLVTQQATLRHLTDASIPEELFGMVWDKQIFQISDTDLIHYTIGDPIEKVQDINLVELQLFAGSIEELF